MYKLLTVNGTDLRDPDGSLEISKKDLVNEYEGEDGRKTLEIVRRNIISGSVSYSGLTVSMLKEIMDSLSTLTTFVIYDPMIDDTVEIEARVSNVSTKKLCHQNNVSVWTLSFNFDEL